MMVFRYAYWFNFGVEGVISSSRKKYIDTRTQANLKKLMANPAQDYDIIVENMSTLVQNRRQLGISLSLSSYKFLQ